MGDALTHDANALHRALDSDGDEVQLTLSRETAEWLVHIVDARSRGQHIVVTQRRHEVTPADAARMLGVSRPQVRKFMDEGKLGFRMVGSHHRIPVESIEAFKEWEGSQMTSGIEELSRLQNELGLVD